MQKIVNNKASRQRQSRIKTRTGQEKHGEKYIKAIKKGGGEIDSFAVSDLVSLQHKSLKKNPKGQMLPTRSWIP